MRDSQVTTCPRGCCQIWLSTFLPTRGKRERCQFRRGERLRAGVFIYDPAQKKVLLIQSCGQHWGPPKGGVRTDETLLEGALREVREETGLTLSPDLFPSHPYSLDRSAHYYYLELPETWMTENIPVRDNDGSGLTWIRLECLPCLSRYGSVTRHCRVLLRRFLGVELEK